MDGQDHRLPRRPGEVELLRQVAEDRLVLPHVGSGIGSAVGRGVEALAVEEAVLDELEVRVEAQRLVIDVALLRVRTDQHRRHANAVTLPVDLGRHDVVVEAAPVVPREEDRRRAPLGASHHRVDEARHVRLALRDARRRVLAHGVRRHDPRDRRQRPLLRSFVEARDRLDVAELAVVSNGVEVGQRVPDTRCARRLVVGHARQRPGVFAVGLGARYDVVPPRDAVLVQQVGQVGPGEDVVIARRDLAGAHAAERIVVRAACRPSGHHVEVSGQAP